MNVVPLLTRLAAQDIRLWLENGNLRYSAPDGAMTPDVISDLRAAKADIIAFLQQSEAARSIHLPVADRSQPLPVSHAQQRLWFIHQLDPANTAYHIHVALHIRGELDAGLLGQASSEIVRRHEILRTRYIQQGGTVQQVIDPPFEVTILPESLAAETLPQALHDELHTPFDLQGRIFRIRLWQMGDTDFALSFTIHHIAADGWSLGIFVNELVQLYESLRRGQPAPLPELPRQYADYVLWQQQDSERHDQQLDYWKRQLADVPNLSLPYDAPPSTYISNEGGFVTRHLDQARLDNLHQLNKANGTTLFMSLLAALSVLLHRYSQQQDFCIGTPVAGRSVSQLEPMIGCFLNVLAIRCQPRPEQTFSEFLHTLKTNCTAAFANQDIPFERIVQEVVQERDLAISPLFQVLLSVQNAPLNAISLPGGLDITPYSDTEAAAQFDLKLTASEETDGLVLRFEYRKALFRTETVERLADHFITLLHSLVSNPQLPLYQAHLFTASQQQQLLGLQPGGWNDTASAWPQEEHVIHLFEQQAVATPYAIAVSDPAISLNYGDFNTRSNRLAHYLLQHCQLKPTAKVVICHRPDAGFLTAVYAVLKAGGCYIPVDPNYPDDRIAHIIADADAALVIVDPAQQQRLQLPADTCVCLADILPQLENCSTTNPGIAINPDDAIYCIYTSGSTGVPKGVAVKHQGESNLIHWYNREFDFGPQDRFLVISAVGFDLTQKNLFAPLCSGGSVVFPGLDYYEPAAIVRCIDEQGITAINCAPSALYPLLQYANGNHSLRSLRTVLLGGEPIRMEIVRPWLESTQFRCELVNMYGPTECTDIASIYRIRSVADLQVNVIPMGKPIANTQLHILDQQCNLLPIGAVGELYIGGAGLGIGYVNKPELTAQSFIRNPFAAAGHPSALLYKTGDLVRYHNDGNIEYVARTDHQVKIRGLRIELGEIESRLQKVPGIHESLVLARTKPDTDDEQVLVAYFLANGDAPGTASIRHQLLLELPQYMIPSFFIALHAWPLSANGKIDRKALPEPDWAQLGRRDYVAPTTATQATLATIWAEVLGVEKVGIHDSFFELGGHSLTATQAIARAQEAFAVDVPLREIFENPTIAAIAELVDKALLEKAVFSNTADTDDDTESFIL